jgi:hypothetical protein
MLAVAAVELPQMRPSNVRDGRGKLGRLDALKLVLRLAPPVKGLDARIRTTNARPGFVVAFLVLALPVLSERPDILAWTA